MSTSSLSAIANFMTQETAAERFSKDVKVLETMTDAEKTPEICLSAAKLDGHLIRFMNSSQRTPEVLAAGLTQKGYALRHLTDAERTPELILLALRGTIYAIEHIKSADVMKPGSAELHEFLAERWSDIVPILQEARARDLGEAILHASGTKT